MRFNGIFNNKTLINFADGDDEGTNSNTDKQATKDIKIGTSKALITEKVAAIGAFASGVAAVGLSAELAKRTINSSAEAQRIILALQGLSPELREVMMIPNVIEIASHKAFQDIFKTPSMLDALTNNVNFLRNPNLDKILELSKGIKPTMINPFESLNEGIAGLLGKTQADILKNFDFNKSSPEFLKDLVGGKVKLPLSMAQLDKYQFVDPEVRKILVDSRLTKFDALLNPTPASLSIINDPKLTAILGNDKLSDILANANLEKLTDLKTILNLSDPKIQELLKNSKNIEELFKGLDKTIVDKINADPKLLELLKKQEIFDVVKDPKMMDSLMNLVGNKEGLDFVKKMTEIDPKFLSELMNNPKLKDLLLNPDLRKILTPELIEFANLKGMENILDNKELLTSLAGNKDLMNDLLKNKDLVAALQDNAVLKNEVTQHFNSPVAIALYSMVGLSLVCCLALVIMKALKKDTVTKEDFENANKDRIDKANNMHVKLTKEMAQNKDVVDAIVLMIDDDNVKQEIKLGAELLYEIRSNKQLEPQLEEFMETLNILKGENIVNINQEDINELIALVNNLPESFKKAFEPIVFASADLLNALTQDRQERYIEVYIEVAHSNLKKTIENFSQTTEAATLINVINVERGTKEPAAGHGAGSSQS